MPSEAMDVDCGQFVGRRLSHVAFVVDLHELSPVGRRPAGGRDGRWFERFAEMCQALISRGQSHPGLLPLANLRFEVSRLLPAVCDESDVATTPRARKRKLLAHPGHEFGLWRHEVSWEGGLARAVTAHLLGERGQIGLGNQSSRQLSSAGGLPAGGPAARHRLARRRRRSRTHAGAHGD